ncbi:DNA-directed RNA polymerase subunit delta [Sporomusa sp.]|uniref:DNA-directed RNA polymerase subunit delta n=1 Tax=Sporomusa sp. TaxID=2078658 RepID=UPI002C1697FE|nr:DNA-directed RNA polymerase subunit delta [Sporomusa sp.]HWR43689.1 DNA-directed RNA polymerase subunit delta [Sporomusa sp.]
MANNISKKDVAEVSLAYQILKTAGHPLYYRDLIDRVVAEKGSTVRPQAHIIAEIHTQINLDSRFVHTGKSTWGLTEWSPQRISLREAEETAAARQDDVRREKLLAAIQQDFDHEDAGLAEEPADLIEGDTEEEDEEELETS